jgi:hypothetical protein
MWKIFVLKDVVFRLNPTLDQIVWEVHDDGDAFSNQRSQEEHFGRIDTWKDFVELLFDGLVHEKVRESTKY